VNKRKHKQRVDLHLTRYDGPEEEVILKTFLPVQDSLTSNLSKRAEWIGNLFSFFFEKFGTIDSDELREGCEPLANVYHQDLN